MVVLPNGAVHNQDVLSVRLKKIKIKNESPDGKRASSGKCGAHCPNYILLLC